MTAQLAYPSTQPITRKQPHRVTIQSRPQEHELVQLGHGGQAGHTTVGPFAMYLAVSPVATPRQTSWIKFPNVYTSGNITARLQGARCKRA